ELTERLSDANAGILSRSTETSMYNFLAMHRALYENQYQYRALFVSLPLLLKQDPEFAAKYAERQLLRKKAIYQELKSLFLGGYFLTAKAQDLDTILNAIVTLNRFWISEATVDETIDEGEAAITMALQKLAGLLHIISTDKGKEEIKKFLKELK